MNEIAPEPSRRLRWAHEFMLSLNLAWIAVWLVRVRSKTLGGPALAHRVSASVGEAYQLVSPIGGYTILEQVVWSICASLILFFVLRFTARMAITKFTLRTIAGLLAIGAFPFASLFLGLTYPACCAGTSVITLTLELILVLTCGIVFYFYLGRRWISTRLMAAVLVLHFAIWAWVTSSYVNVPDLLSDLRNSEYYHPWSRALGVMALDLTFTLGFAIFGLLSSLIWVRFVGRPSQLTRCKTVEALPK